MRDAVTAFAPGSVGNVGPGLDILGLAVSGLGDRVTLHQVDGTGITIIDAGHPELSKDPARHAAAIAVAAVIAEAGASIGVTLSLAKGLPLSGGQGGSAASAVAGAVAANALLEAGLDSTALLRCALVAETVVAGRHADNLAPSLLGGFVLIRSLDPIDVIRVPLPANLRVVLVLPEQRLRTRDARAVLPAEVPRPVALAQAANVAAMVAAAFMGDIAAFGRAIDDRIAEPVRAPLLPGFLAARDAARRAGAFGASISGAGPTAFAIVGDDPSGERVAAAMIAAYTASGVGASARVAAVDHTGARVIA